MSHRAVAARARLPLAATTYYFADLDELVAAAAAARLAAWVEEAGRLVDGLAARRRGAAATARLVLSVLLAGGADDDPALLAYYETFVQSGRRPGVRAVAAQARRDVDLLLGALLERCGWPNERDLVRLVVAAADGAMLSALVEGQGAARAAGERAVGRLLAALRPPREGQGPAGAERRSRTRRRTPSATRTTTAPTTRTSRTVE